MGEFEHAMPVTCERIKPSCRALRDFIWFESKLYLLVDEALQEGNV